MSSGRARQLWAKALLGERLDAAEDAELRALLLGDEELRRDFLRDAKTHGLLDTLLRGSADAEADVRQFRERVAAERESSGFLRRVEARLASSRSRTRRVRRRLEAAAGLPSLVAAALLVGLLLLVGFGGGGRRKERLRPEPVVRIQDAAEPETPEPAPPRPRPAPRPAAPREEAIEQSEPEPFVPPPPPEPLHAPGPPPFDAQPAPPRESRVAVATVASARGAWAVAPAGRRLLRAGEALSAGEDVEVDLDGEAALTYPDGTKLEARGGTSIADIGKRTRVPRGVVTADVVRQPRGQEMVFSTPHADAVVLGTRLRLTVQPERTKLEVLEGRVRFRIKGGKDVDVSAGFHATAGEGADSSAKVPVIDEILLLPGDGKIVGRDWRIARDDHASSGWVLEAPEKRRAAETQERLRASALGFVEFSFTAEAQKEYFVWIRGSASVKDEKHDAVALDAGTGRFLAPCAHFGARLPNLYFVSGYAYVNGYVWIGGLGDPFAKTVGPVTVAGRGDEVPARIHYARSGPQKLRLYPIETPVRIDAIWLSSTRKTRPEPHVRGP